MKVSVVIPTKNRVEDLKKCVECLVNQTVLPYELIVVDGSDNDETRKYVNRLKESVNFCCIYVKQRHGGTATARNIGLNVAHGDIVLFVDDDVLLCPDYIEKLVQSFETDETIGCIGGNPSPDKDKQKNSKLFKLFNKIFGVIFLRDSFKPGKVTVAGHHAALPYRTSYVEWLGTSQIACRKEVFKSFRFDENLEKYSTYAFYEDLDFTYRVSRKYKLLLNSELKAIHVHSSTSVKNAFNVNFTKILNHYYLVRKHEFSKMAFWWSTIGLLLAHVILLLLKPSKVKLHGLRGLIEGIKKITKGGRLLCGK